MWRFWSTIKWIWGAVILAIALALVTKLPFDAPREEYVAFLLSTLGFATVFSPVALLADRSDCSSGSFSSQAHT
jgi:membrane protease YdiL (CAAX protease family)